MKTVQHFDEAYLARCAEMTTEDIARFLDDFRRIHGSQQITSGASKLISIKIQEPLLAAFKAKAALHNERYQTKIKQLMLDWLTQNSETEEH